jgi:hypothetical protein
MGSERALGWGGARYWNGHEMGRDIDGGKGHGTGVA